MDTENIKQIINLPARKLKRPNIRQPCGPITPFVRPTKGVVYDIINMPQYVHLKPKPTIAQDRCEEYLELLKRNYDICGVKFRELNIMDLKREYVIKSPPERHIEYIDSVQVSINVLKSGKIRVKCTFHATNLYDNYYTQSKSPPLKVLTTAYKNMGYSDEYINNININHKAKLTFGNKLNKVFDTIFKNSASSKKKKVEPKKVEEEENDSGDDIEEEEEDGPEEDEALVADDEEEDVEEIVEEDLDIE